MFFQKNIVHLCFPCCFFPSITIKSQTIYKILIFFGLLKSGGSSHHMYWISESQHWAKNSHARQAWTWTGAEFTNGWMSECWLPSAYWMTTLCHEPGTVMHNLQFYQTNFQLHLQDTIQVAHLTQLESTIHLSYGTMLPLSEWLSPSMILPCLFVFFLISCSIA